ncbi:hypothetical protein AB4156_20260 [Cupriavidus sp. 2MCAB6]|uniref:hypothetical protein n=1 Tax=Cupriavidus sp. 2MCAB6 TaxID=3232981 RepID=UPI003F917039
MCKQCESNAGALFTAAQIGIATHENAATGLSGAAAIYEAIIRLTTAADAPDNFDVIEGLARVGAQLTNTSLFAVDGWREKLDSSVHGLERAEASHG